MYIEFMIQRTLELDRLIGLLKRFPVVGIIGARQVGKTTLARVLRKSITSPTAYFDLENPEDMSRLSDPMLALKQLSGVVIIDEIQRSPELFPVLRVLADRQPVKTRFLILGSASPELKRHGSETLAGRIYYHELSGFSIDEVGIEHHERLWLRGGFPDSYLALSHAKSAEWRRGFIRTFLERDLPQLGITIRSITLRRFWAMLAHYHGQTWNSSEFARSFGVADTTVRNYLDILTSALVIRQLPAWHENIAKRQVKAPKVYIADSGVLHTLLNLETMKDVESHPKLGASWEGFVIDQIVRRLGARPDESYFWATHAGAELDMLVVRGRTRLGFEVKRTSSPQVTPSMRNALADLKLQKLYVIHAGDQSFSMHKQIYAIGLKKLLTDLKPLSH
ncbi:MAG: ATPase superfamily-like protein [Bacteroidetes bacterium]|nr:ATPase superfamily-like protein [Bacteroidota bacterium]